MSFLEFRECPGCGEWFPVRSPKAHRAKWCSERCRKNQYAGTCEDCGGPTNGSDGRGPNAAKQCQACNADRLGAETSEAMAAYRQMVEEMWAEGMTARAIGEALGWSSKQPGTHISLMRSRGYDLPHRRTPEQLARITAGSDQRLAKARAVYRETKAAA